MKTNYMDLNGYVNHHLEKRKEYHQRKQDMRKTFIRITTSKDNGKKNEINLLPGPKSTRRIYHRSLRKKPFVPNPTITTIYEEDEMEEQVVPEEDQQASVASNIAILQPVNVEFISIELDNEEIVLPTPELQLMTEMGVDDYRNPKSEVTNTEENSEEDNDLVLSDTSALTDDDHTFGTPIALCITIIFIMAVVSFLLSFKNSAHTGRADYTVY